VRIKVEGGAPTNRGTGMARYKHIDASPRLLPVDLARQLLPGTFEHALNHLLDHEIDLSGFDARFCNDETGAMAYPPAMLLKVVLFAYSQGIVSSRGIERACRDHVTFIALCGDSGPWFITSACTPRTEYIGPRIELGGRDAWTSFEHLVRRAATLGSTRQSGRSAPCGSAVISRSAAFSARGIRVPARCVHTRLSPAPRAEAPGLQFPD